MPPGRRLLRSKTDVDEADRIHEALFLREKRGFSFSTLTGKERRARLSKANISKPILAPGTPLYGRTDLLELGCVSPATPPNTPNNSAFFSPASVGRGHSHSSPGPQPNPIHYVFHTASYSAPITPVTPYSSSIPCPTYSTPSHFEPQLESERPKWREAMESLRLQPPLNAGTKGRAIQQAKEMEVLVAERAKRSGDEPPPYDFFELIGKGSYGRVFKGYVTSMTINTVG